MFLFIYLFFLWGEWGVGGVFGGVGCEKKVKLRDTLSTLCI